MLDFSRKENVFFNQVVDFLFCRTIIIGTVFPGRAFYMNRIRLQRIFKDGAEVQKQSIASITSCLMASDIFLMQQLKERSEHKVFSQLIDVGIHNNAEALQTPSLT